jgi:uncharacterized BrkB/YihY/UPF0761 family membrane protein
MTTNQNSSSFSRKGAWAALVIVALAAIAVVLVPVWLIMPFKPQTQRGLEISYALRRWSPLVTVAALVLALALVVWLWRGSRRWWRKALLIAVVVPLLAATWFARQNHFEWMFKPLPDDAYARASEVTFVADTDMVLAVESKNDAVAYPVRLMAYHHLVQDEVGGTAVVATY